MIMGTVLNSLPVLTHLVLIFTILPEKKKNKTKED